MATTSQLITENAEYIIYKQAIDNNDGGEILHLHGAKTLYVHATTALTFTVPACTDAGVPIDTTDASTIDIPAGEAVFNPTASVAGVIPAGHMPLFLQIGNTSGGASVAFIYIIKK